MNRVSETIKKLFPDDFEEIVPVKEKWWQKFEINPFEKGWSHWVIIAIVCIAFGLLTCATIHYFNIFVTLEAQLLTNKAQIEAQLQRRKDLIVNLTKTVIDYAAHERKMFLYVADKRANSVEKDERVVELLEKLGVADVTKLKDNELNSVMGSLMALAENYPELKLSNNFQKLMDALVNIEDRIVEWRMEYNNACNLYGTYTRKFPQRIFAAVFKFEGYPFVKVDKDVELFNRVEY